MTHWTREGAISGLQFLDLSVVQEMLRKLQQWDGDKVLRVSAEYKRFLLLHILHPDADIVPLTAEVHEFWRAHILCTRKYELDCRTLFGSYFHHEGWHLDDFDGSNESRRRLTRDLSTREFERSTQNYEHVVGKVTRGVPFLPASHTADEDPVVKAWTTRPVSHTADEDPVVKAWYTQPDLPLGESPDHGSHRGRSDRKRSSGTRSDDGFGGGPAGGGFPFG